MTWAEIEEQAEAGRERLWRAEEVAQRLAVSRSTVFTLLADGRLMSVRIGGSRRIPESAVLAFIASLERS